MYWNNVVRFFFIFIRTAFHYPVARIAVCILNFAPDWFRTLKALVRMPFRICQSYEWHKRSVHYFIMYVKFYTKCNVRTSRLWFRFRIRYTYFSFRPSVSANRARPRTYLPVWFFFFSFGFFPLVNPLKIPPESCKSIVNKPIHVW